VDVKTVDARIEIKDEDKGEFVAVFATKNVLDAHGDVTLDGAFPDGKSIVVSAYGHASWGFWAAAELPVGDAVIKETKTEARAEGRMYLDSTGGRDTFITVKGLAEKKLGEWSYGYDPLEYSFGVFGDRKNARFLKKLDVFEACPVLRGAGLRTRTVLAKALHTAGLDDEQTRIVLTALSEDVGSAAATLADEIAATVGALAALVDSADRVGALRAQAGKHLSGKLQANLDQALSTLERLRSSGVDAPETSGVLSPAQLARMRYVQSLRTKVDSYAIPGA